MPSALQPATPARRLSTRSRACTFTFFWLWNIAGKEIVTLDDEALTIRYALGPTVWTRRFGGHEVTDLRVSPPATANFRSLAWWPGGGTIAFD